MEWNGMPLSLFTIVDLFLFFSICVCRIEIQTQISNFDTKNECVAVCVFHHIQIVNDIVGHISHGLLLVPYWPWARSHRMHHMFHNDGAKDLSHWWFHPDMRELDEGAIPYVYCRRKGRTQKCFVDVLTLAPFCLPTGPVVHAVNSI